MPKCNDRYCWFPNEVLTSRYSCAVCGAYLHFDCGVVLGATNRECWQCRKSSNVASSEKGSEISSFSSIRKRSAAVNSSFGRRDKGSKETKNNNSTSTTSTTTEAAAVAEQEGSINNNDATGTRNGASNLDQLMGLKNTTTTTSTTTTEGAAAAEQHGSININDATGTNTVVEITRTTIISQHDEGSKFKSCEYEVLLFPHVKFGIGLRMEAENQGQGAIAVSFLRFSGSIMPAEESGMITLGDSVIGINDEDLSYSSFDEIIRCAKRYLGGSNVPLKMKFRPAGSTTASDVNIGPLTGVQMKPLGAVPTEESTGFEDLDEFWEASGTTDQSSALEPQGSNNNNATRTTLEEPQQLSNNNNATSTTLEEPQQLLVCSTCGGTPCQWEEFGQAVINLMMQAYDHDLLSEKGCLFDFETKQPINSETARGLALKCFQYSKYGTISPKAKPVPKCVKRVITLFYPPYPKNKDGTIN